MKIDGHDSYIREYLRLRKVEYWEDLENHVLGNYFPVKDSDTGKVITLQEQDCCLFSKLVPFMRGIDNDNPLSWTLRMWRSWRSENDVSTMGIPSTIGGRSGTTIEVQQQKGNDTSTIGSSSTSKIAALKHKMRELKKRTISPQKMKTEESEHETPEDFKRQPPRKQPPSLV